MPAGIYTLPGYGFRTITICTMDTYMAAGRFASIVSCSTVHTYIAVEQADRRRCGQRTKAIQQGTDLLVNEECFQLLQRVNTMQTTPRTSTNEPVKTVDDSAHGNLRDPEGMCKSSEDNGISRFTAHDVGQGNIFIRKLLYFACMVTVLHMHLY